jgi:hypothetical protein
LHGFMLQIINPQFSELSGLNNLTASHLIVYPVYSENRDINII